MDLQNIVGKIGHLEATSYFPFSISGSEVYGITCVLVVSAVSAGVNIGNPVVVSLQHSWDDATWNAVPGAELYNASSVGTATQVEGAGTYILTPTAASGKIAPRCQVKIVVPAGESAEVSQLQRTRLGTEESYGLSPAEQVFVPAASTLVQNALVKVAYDTILPVFNALTDVYTYKTGGIAGTTVATLTVTYIDATKETIQSVVSV